MNEQRLTWCPDCRGEGKITIPNANFIGHRRVGCPTCAGDGRVPVGTRSRYDEIAIAIERQLPVFRLPKPTEPVR